MTDSSTRAYKGFTPRMGVYRVTHTPTGRTLLGQSSHVQGFLNRLHFQLEHGSHPNRAMQRDWKDSGPDYFTFEVLDDLTPDPTRDPTDDLKELLGIWQEKLSIPAELRY